MEHAGIVEAEQAGRAQVSEEEMGGGKGKAEVLGPSARGWPVTAVVCRKR